MGSIAFFSVDTDFTLENEAWIRQRLAEIVTLEHFQLAHLNYVFGSDAYLLKLNIDYLEHDYLTDVITFDNAISPLTIDGDIFISIDRVRENATDFRVDFESELVRVLIHGVLHLLGYQDSTRDQIKIMRQKENSYLRFFVA